MPLRDHFHLPTNKYASWEGLHGGWPMMIVLQIDKRLPPGFAAEPRVHLGQHFEIDVSAFAQDESRQPSSDSPADGGVAVAAWAPPRPTLSLATSLPDQYEYAVHIYDTERQRRLVAAVEIVSPANKDRVEHRRAFVAKTAALIQQGVCVSIVDLVTERHFNLYAELLELIGESDPSLGPEPTPIYAATCRGRKTKRKRYLDNWLYPLQVGQPLPTLHLWLSDDSGVMLDLESSYEETCRALRIP